jgi:hypothetical protein
LNNLAADESVNTERNYKSSESLYSHDIYADKYDHKGHLMTANEVEVHHVVDYAWVIHVYLTGVLMTKNSNKSDDMNALQK